jgi:hypothetical protein
MDPRTNPPCPKCGAADAYQSPFSGRWECRACGGGRHDGSLLERLRRLAPTKTWHMIESPDHDYSREVPAFDRDGCVIHDPRTDETGRFDLPDPASYYDLPQAAIDLMVQNLTSSEKRNPMQSYFNPPVPAHGPRSELWSCRYFTLGGWSPQCERQRQGAAPGQPPAGWTTTGYGVVHPADRYTRSYDCPACVRWGADLRQQRGMGHHRATPRRNPGGGAEAVKAELRATILERKAWERPSTPGRLAPSSSAAYKAWAKKLGALNRREESLEAKLSKLIGVNAAEAFFNRVQNEDLAANPYVNPHVAYPKGAIVTRTTTIRTVRKPKKKNPKPRTRKIHALAGVRQQGFMNVPIASCGETNGMVTADPHAVTCGGCKQRGIARDARYLASQVGPRRNPRRGGKRRK